MTKHILYVDMDGVVADFDSAVVKKFNISDQEKEIALKNTRWSEDRWKKIIQDPHFYRDLPKMPQADQLISLAKRFRDNLGWELYMLTAIPKNNDIPDCIHDKILWMQQHYPGIPVRFGPYAKDKQKYARPGDILVDDKPSNIEEWRQAGGTAIQVTEDYDVALIMLEKYYIRAEKNL